MESAGVFVSPVAIAVAFVWNFAALASVQLTVRLIRAFSVRRTLASALALTLATIPITAAYYAAGRSLTWLPVTILLTAAVAFVVVKRVLRVRRPRSAITASIGVGILAAPWGAFLVR